MIPIELKTLFAKLNSNCLQTLSGAVGLCSSRRNDYVEISHWLLKILELPDSDVHRICQHYRVDVGRLSREINTAIDKIRRGSGSKPGWSREVEDLVRESWTVTTLTFNAFKVRTGYLFTALILDRTLCGSIRDASPEFCKITADKLLAECRALIMESPEEESAGEIPSSGGSSGNGDGSQPVKPGSKTPSLDQFTQNLTERAKAGKIDPVIGRDFEIRQMIDILTRRRQNNPILTGEAGVGKTAVVEGFAIRVAANDVPDSLKNVEVRTLDLGLLQAGAGVKGEFENRLKSVIQEVKSSPHGIILFIDEAHTMIGAGGAAGQGDAANLLKPALARGELRTIAATTWMEYKKFFETDPALKRRFQVIRVEEPDISKAAQMMRSFANTLEKHHKVRILDEAVVDAVKLSHRYITDRQLPDKCVSLLDTACAKVALGQSTTPAEIEESTRDIEHAGVEIAMLDKEVAVGASHDERLKELNEIKTAAEEKLKKLTERWTKEKELVAKIQERRSKLEAALGIGANKGQPLKPEEEKKLKDELGDYQKQLTALQGDSPLVQPVVDGQAVAEVVSGWTGIPIGKMVLDEIKTVLALKDKMEERVIGQAHALEAIAQRIRTARAGMIDPRRPIGVFLLVGPSGVGKTETAMALADILYGGDRSMVIINMSEYKESHKISNLVGSSKGLVGYGTGGVLTEAVRRKPYSVVLLDEVEKAHVDVQELFYQVFDKGMLQDSTGEDIDFKNTIILLTSNAGTDAIMKLCADPDTKPDPVGFQEALRPELLKAFKPALLGRMAVVPYYPLDDAVIRKIIGLNLKKISARVKENHKAAFSYDDALVAAIASRCKEVESGARNVEHIISGTLLPQVSQEILTRMAEGLPITKVHVGVDDKGDFAFKVE